MAIISILLIFASLTGVHSISTVKEVMVEKGSSISIPCFYGSKYTDNVKYLCKGCRWTSCTYEIRTDKPNSRKYSISDNKEQRMVTFIIKDLKETDCYWCNMEIEPGTDDGEKFKLVVTGKGHAKLYVDSQEVTGFIGDQITIYCHYRGSRQIKWCKTGHAGPTSCIKNSGWIDNTKVTINRNKPDVIIVTMSEVTKRNSGWYWCADEDQQMPVHITIKERPATTTTTSQSTSMSSTSKPVTHTYMSQETTIEQTGTPSSSFINLLSFIIPLCLLLVIVTVAVIVFFMMKRRKSPSTAEDEQTVTYSTVMHVRNPSAKQINSEDKADVTYSNVFYIAKPNTHQVEDKDENVTYSTVAHHH